jgi:hypothetical protein
MRKLAVAILIAIFLPGLAYAQTPRARPALTGNPIDDIKNATGGGAAANSPVLGGSSSPLDALLKPLRDLADFIGADIDGAIALSTQIDNLKDGHGQQCLLALKDFGNVIKAHPAPLTLKLATDLEALRLQQMAVNRLCNNVHCTQVFGDFTIAVTALSPVPLPVPSLHDLCGKVPQIAIVDPVAVPVAPVIPPTNPPQP